MRTLTLRDLAFVGSLGGGYDPDAAAYISAVEAADGQSLESGVKDAIDAFVRGCKADGIWTAIKASCILAGARTLSGALVPLLGPAPTNNGFVSGDYDRKTGLKGNGSSKYLTTNRGNGESPQNDRHIALYVSARGKNIVLWMSGNWTAAGETSLGTPSGNLWASASGSGWSDTSIGLPSTNFFAGISRSSSASFVARIAGTQATVTKTSDSAGSGNLNVFAASTASFHSDGTFAFYSAGHALDLAAYRLRVDALISAIAAAIP